jgi:uncharacterized protein (DUF58 family)
MTLPADIDPSAILARARKQAERFALPLRDRQWRGRAGEFLGRGTGSSLDFHDHRHYLPGDDPRHINWQAYARTGDYTMKLYREEVRPVVELFLDASGSMFAPARKAERALDLFYLAVASAEREGATLHATALRGGRAKALEPAALAGRRWLDGLEALPEDSPSLPPRLDAIPMRPHSLRVLVSDLLYPAAPEPTLRTLAQGAGRALVLAPTDPAESDPGWSGNCEFHDTEGTGRHERRIDAALLRRYLESYRRHFDRWKSAALGAGVSLASVRSDLPLDDSLRLEALPSGTLALA